MSTTTEKLAELNVLRAERNQPALKSWKGSNAALDQTLAAYKTKKVPPAVAEGAYKTAEQAEASTELKGKHVKARAAIAKANKPTGEVKGAKDSGDKPKPAAKKGEHRSDVVSLADIARELKIEPKLARARARRSDEMMKLATGDTWAFKPADVAKVKKFLKGD